MQVASRSTTRRSAMSSAQTVLAGLTRDRNGAATTEPPRRQPRWRCPGQTYERHRSGDQPSHNGDNTFEAVVADSEVFESLASTNKIGTGQPNNTHFITRI